MPMTRQQKADIVAELKQKFNDTDVLYITDSSALTVEQMNNFRGKCFENDIEFRVAKNTLIKRALEASDNNYDDLYPVLKGTSAIMFSAIANTPAKVLKEFRKDHDKPLLKAAFFDNDIFLGDEQIKVLSELKSKDELVGEIIGLLQSPIKNVIGALQSGGSKIAGIVKTLSEREEN